MSYPNIYKIKNYHQRPNNQHKKLQQIISDRPNNLIPIPGVPGKDGSKIYVESDEPNDTMGKNGDLYIDRLTGEYYKKICGQWVFQNSIVGPPGEKGDSGQALLTYTLVSTEIVPVTLDPEYVTVTYFPWDYEKYSMYNNYILTLYSVVIDTYLLIRVIDDNNNIIAGPLTITSTGFSTLNLVEPLADTNLSIQICKNQNTGTVPSLFSIVIEIT